MRSERLKIRRLQREKRIAKVLIFALFIAWFEAKTPHANPQRPMVCSECVGPNTP